MHVLKSRICFLVLTCCSHLLQSTSSFQLKWSTEKFKSTPEIQNDLNSKQHLPSSSSLPSSSRRQIVSSVLFLLGLQQQVSQNPSNAAPPFAVIAEELGYFPVTNKANQTMYVPSRVKRSSSDQAIDFAEYLHSKNTIMYGAFWCPHCQNQKEILGREAFSKITYVECDSRGYNPGAAMCMKDNISGFPTWKIGKKVISGEMSLQDLAKASGYRGVVDPSLERDLPSSRDGVCK